MFRISIKKTHQQKRPTTLQVFFFGKWPPLGIAGKSNITKTLWSFQNQRFWSCFFAEIFSFRDVGSVSSRRRRLLVQSHGRGQGSPGEIQETRRRVGGGTFLKGWMVPFLNGSVFAKMRHWWFVIDFFCFRNDHLTCILLQSWMSETRMVEIYVCTSLHEQSCNCKINASEIGWFVKQSLSGVMLGKVELHPTLGGCMNRWPSLPWVCSTPMYMYIEREKHTCKLRHILHIYLFDTFVRKFVDADVDYPVFFNASETAALRGADV